MLFPFHSHSARRKNAGKGIAEVTHTQKPDFCSLGQHSPCPQPGLGRWVCRARGWDVSVPGEGEDGEAKAAPSTAQKIWCLKHPHLKPSAPKT